MPFRTALSGLSAASTDLKVTGNNIANAATHGFKQSRTEFADVFAVTFGGTTANTTGGGVKVADAAQEFSQGNVEFTEKALDLAVSGEGFFVVDDSEGRSYTRAGSFHVDESGVVVNALGQRLKVFPPTAVSTPTSPDFNTGMLTDLQLTTTAGPPNATTNVAAGLNLNAMETPPLVAPFDYLDPSSYNDSTSLVVYDSLGAQHTGSLYFVKTATPNQWDSYFYVNNTPILDSGGASPTTLVFDTNGYITSPANGLVDYPNIPAGVLGTGAGAMAITMDMSNTTQFGSAFGVTSLAQDGYASGQLNDIDIDEEGVVFARYTNGQSNVLGQVALANFTNPQGLRQLGDTSWAESTESGPVVLGAAGTGGMGLMQSGALESSNVDIASQLVNLILAQRNFQANAQVISTNDTVTQTIINI